MCLHNYFRRLSSFSHLLRSLALHLEWLGTLLPIFPSASLYNAFRSSVQAPLLLRPSPPSTLQWKAFRRETYSLRSCRGDECFAVDRDGVSYAIRFAFHGFGGDQYHLVRFCSLGQKFRFSLQCYFVRDFHRPVWQTVYIDKASTSEASCYTDFIIKCFLCRILAFQRSFCDFVEAYITITST